MTEKVKVSRREQILQALAAMLQTHAGHRITTAALAQQVGVSEAALYRHFPSKAKMFEGLLGFVEETLFTRINRIQTEVAGARKQCATILHLLLAFSEKNPGITALLTGQALTGEHERLRLRVDQCFARVETQLKQILREDQAQGAPSLALSVSSAAQLLLLQVEGRLLRFVRSEFKQLPLDHWAEQWELLAQQLWPAPKVG